MSISVDDAEPVKNVATVPATAPAASPAAAPQPLRGYFPVVPEWILEHRRLTGSDQWDEMWEGVLHMAPDPTVPHQDLQGGMYIFLHHHLKGRFLVHERINLSPPGTPGGWTKDYRTPDINVISRERQAAINRNSHFEGPPEVVIEVKSPGDESEEKIPFYAGLGVTEAWIVDRDTREPRVLALDRSGASRERPAGPGGWVRSEVTGIEMRAREGKLEMRAGGDDAAIERIHEE